MSILEKTDASLEKNLLRIDLEKKCAQIDLMVNSAKGLNVDSRWSAEDAMNFAIEARSLYKTMESTRKEITGPARSFINHVNDTVKIFTEKLLHIEEIIADKIEAWKEEEKELAELVPFQDSDVDLKNVRSEKASFYEVSHYTFDVEDLSLVPKEFLMIDEAKVKAAIKAGMSEIPGIKIKKQQKTVLRAR